MIEIKIYRATLFAALLVVVFVLFSLKPQPQPKVSALAPDAFDGVSADRTLKRIVNEYPDRRPGSEGDRKVAGLVEAKLAGLGFEVTRQDFERGSGGHSLKLTNVVGVLRGDSEQNIVVIAHRDAGQTGEAIPSGTGTAVLLELATALNGVRHHKTITLVSTDAGTLAGAGARAFSERFDEKGLVDGMFVLDNFGTNALRQPLVVPWSDNDQLSPLTLERTTERAVKVEVGKASRGFGTVEQIVRLAFPVALQEQGTLLAAGFPAITISSNGELPLAAGAGSLESVSKSNLTKFGKATLAAVLAIDGAKEIDQSPDRYVFFAGRVMPGWAIRMLVLTFLLPVVFVSVDALARAMRGRLPVADEILRVLLRSLPFLVFLLGSYLFNSIGLLPEPVSSVFNPSTFEASIASTIGWVVLASGSVGSYLYSRRFVASGKAGYKNPDTDASGVALSLVLVCVALALWLVNPFTVLLLLPAVHIWVFVPYVDIPGKVVVLPLMVVAGLAGIIAVLVYYSTVFDLGLSVFHYFGLLYAGRSIGFLQAVMDCLIAGCLVTVLVIVWKRIRGHGRSNRSAIGDHAAFSNYPKTR